MDTLPLIKGFAEDWPIQTYLWGGSMPAAYGSGDTLLAGIYACWSGASLFSPTIAWLTKDSAGAVQTGYDQGQVVVSISNAQAAQLEVTGAYFLLITITPAASPSKTYPIARLRLRVDGITI